MLRSVKEREGGCQFSTPRALFSTEKSEMLVIPAIEPTELNSFFFVIKTYGTWDKSSGRQRSICSMPCLYIMFPPRLSGSSAFILFLFPHRAMHTCRPECRNGEERERERETCSSANSDISSLTVTDWQLQPSLLDDEGRGKKGNSITFFPSYNVREKSEGRRARNERKSRVRSDRTKQRKGGGKGNSYLCKRDPFLIERDRDGNGRPSPSPRTTTMGG